MNDNKSGYNKTKEMMLILLLIIVYVVILQITGIGCPIRRVIHYPCPSCGMTRAWISVLHGDFMTALKLHPLFLFIPVFVLSAICSNRKPISLIPKRIKTILFSLGTILIISVYIYRIVNGFGDV